MQTKRQVLVVAALYFLISSCGRHSADVANETPVVEPLHQNLEIATAVMDAMSNEIKLNGKVVPNEGRQAKVYALVSGKISEATKELGDYVQKGQTLAVLRSTEVVNMSNDISLAEANVDMAKKNKESVEDLYKGDLATERELANARLEYSKAVAELKKAKQIAAITGGKNASYVLTAPVSGFIIEKNITNNSEVRQDNDTPLFTIADLTSVWIMANVYERDINNIHLGDEVKVTTLSDPAKEYSGKIDKIYNVLNPGTRSMQVRISMRNETYTLKPEMFATIKVKAKTPGQNVTVPYKALVFENSKQYVVVKKSDEALEKREIQLVKKRGEQAFIQGVETGEQVVTSSPVFLLSALNKK
jgi:cobalt-zinc-cadmium efflux system membrane fusion protein